MEYNRKLVMEDGAEYYGTGFGYTGDAVCEIVFNTSMVGYPTPPTPIRRWL